jgi:DNA invertase Pin-like site-specific DNA recombinase
MLVAEDDDPPPGTTTMTTAIYVRVSSRKQDQASQIPDLERFAANVEGPVKWYRDKATGKTMDRPGWKALEQDFRSGKVTRIVAWRLDRLGRTTAGLTTLFEELVARKVGLVSIRDGFNLATPAGRMMAGVLASVAQYETEVRGERTVAGQDVARARGKHMGRPKGISTPIKVNADQRAAVARMHSEGESIAAISRTVGLARNTVYKILETSETP